jgi:hypothetical protein
MDAQAKRRAGKRRREKIAVLLVGPKHFGNDRMMNNGRRISVLQRIFRPA